ncbi:MAG: hypothetical protein ACTTJH_04125 [Bacteroidales bacterium]
MRPNNEGEEIKSRKDLLKWDNNLLKWDNSFMDTKERKNTLDNSVRTGQVPEDYFHNMEERVLYLYHKRQKVRRLRVMYAACCTVIVLCGITYYLNSSFNQISPQKEKMVLFKDTLKERYTSFHNESVSEKEAFVEDTRSNNEKELSKKYIQSKVSSSKYEKEFTDEEWSYLENYLNEDNYELVYNTLTK